MREHTTLTVKEQTYLVEIQGPTAISLHVGEWHPLRAYVQYLSLALLEEILACAREARRCSTFARFRQGALIADLTIFLARETEWLTIATSYPTTARMATRGGKASTVAGNLPIALIEQAVEYIRDAQFRAETRGEKVTASPVQRLFLAPWEALIPLPAPTSDPTCLQLTPENASLVIDVARKLHMDPALVVNGAIQAANVMWRDLGVGYAQNMVREQRTLWEGESDATI